MAEIPKGFHGRRQRFLTDVTELTQDLLGNIMRRDGKTPYSHHPFRATLRVKDALKKEKERTQERAMAKILVHDDQEVVREKGIMTTGQVRKKVVDTLFWRYPV